MFTLAKVTEIFLTSIRARVALVTAHKVRAVTRATKVANLQDSVKRSEDSCPQIKCNSKQKPGFKLKYLGHKEHKLKFSLKKKVGQRQNANS